MEVILETPDKIAAQLQTNGCSLSRRVLEDLAVEAYCREEVNLSQFAELLNLSINDANGLLKQRGVCDEFSLAEFEAQTSDMERLLGKGSSSRIRPQSIT